MTKLQVLFKWNSLAFVLSVLRIRLLFENQFSSCFITLFSLACTASIFLLFIYYLLVILLWLNSGNFLILLYDRPTRPNGRKDGGGNICIWCWNVRENLALRNILWRLSMKIVHTSWILRHSSDYILCIGAEH
jgi:hypothetical protein